MSKLRELFISQCPAIRLWHNIYLVRWIGSDRSKRQRWALYWGSTISFELLTLWCVILINHALLWLLVRVLGMIRCYLVFAYILPCRSLSSVGLNCTLCKFISKQKVRSCWENCVLIELSSVAIVLMTLRSENSLERVLGIPDCVDAWVNILINYPLSWRGFLAENSLHLLLGDIFFRDYNYRD